VFLSQAVGSSACLAQEAGQRLQFKKPSQAAHGSRVNQANLKFRSPTEPQSVNSATRVERTSYAEPVARAKPSKKPTSVERRPQAVSAQAAKPVRVASKKKAVRRDRQVVAVVDAVVVDHGVEYVPEPEVFADMPMGYEGYDSYGGSCDSCTGGCACEVGCGMTDPSCGFEGPSCGCAEPGCGICEPGCGLVEPSCGLGATNCGSCVGSPGRDYWCFPVCLPRFKDLSAWAGVHGFRGPRDFSNGQSDSNFGFSEGINISGRAPLLGLLFPQLSYQLGYQATQSRLSGTVNSTDDRNQQFVTGGFFRRVKTGLQFGVVWDMLRDDLDREVDYHQVRTEFSLKSPQGREFGFWSATSTNDNVILGTTFETVDMYALFYRWNFGKNYECPTADSEGIFGGEFQAPLSDRLSLVSGFNYLITDEDDGLAGVQEEAWNIGINLVWHMGRTARRGCRSPYRPLFSVANNGWMIVDNVSP